MNDDQFEQLAHGILVAALGSLGLAACGGAESPPSTPTAEPTNVVVVNEPPPVVNQAPTTAPSASSQPPLGPEKLPEATPQGERCGEDDQINLIAQLNPAEPVDFISLRRINGRHRGHAEGMMAIGERCSGASDKATCEKTADATHPPQGFRQGCIPGGCTHNLLYTRGNSVGTATTVEELTSFLGPIDTEGEALLLAWSQQYGVDTCSELPKKLKKTAGGYLLTATKMTKDCPIEITQFNLKVNTNGSIKVLGSKVLSKTGACAGRRPEGFTATDVSSQTCGSVGAYLALSAQLEHASVAAFQHMALELTALGAPQDLLRDAQRAADDEQRHTDTMGRHARRYHAVPESAAVPAPTTRSAYAMALENAVEGCVRETYGALVGLYQAQAAQDLALREAMADIAQDELRHAALSWRVAAWLEPQLSAEERVAIAEAKRQAVAELVAECREEPAPALRALAGLPPANVASGLAAQLQRELWARAEA